MLRVVARRVVNLARIKYYGFLSILPARQYSSCDPDKINEAPILDNECITAHPEETRMRNVMESTIEVPTMVDLSPINGIPEEAFCTRRARIYQPVKNAMQTGTNNIRYWELEFDNKMRWENPLMGWTSGADPLATVRLKFTDPCEAVDYCAKQGWLWYVDVPRTEREFRPKNYANNFSWNKRTRVSTK